ncbi:hypothetical protein AFL01nite_22990 [Aeromicrobium flavum]|uniref:DUF11 domain-containing protein n=1 Tax=Aeromicrobium flavum TaxID=416568 RepID=A0A512HWZ6_9ACTN|nr:hypothetical protein [Aeromicrobium flavum]GEO89972.1 hypothetical protein AFL01nite_22990 [Aeromicrobium flavum]
MSRGRLSVALITAALVGTVLSSVGGAPAQAAPERRLEKKTAVLTTSLPGFPRPATPAHRQLQRVNVSVHYDEDGDIVLEADAWVKGDPIDRDTAVRAHLGVTSGSQCQLTGHYDDGVVPDGRKYWVWERGLRSPRDWDCVVVMMIDRENPDAPVDAMGARLTNQYAEPRLTVSQPRLLGRTQEQVRLVRGVVHRHEVLVKNSGRYRARNIVVTARGKGMKTVRKKVGALQPGEELAVDVPLRLTGKKKRTAVRITVSGSGVSASRAIRVRAVKAPAKPRAGAWRSSNKTFTFKVKNGRIAGFRGANMRMTCGGGFGGFPTYRNVSLTFPKVKVPRHGYVDATKQYRKGNVWYTATLRGRVAGTKMTQARYTYRTAGNCRVTEGFTARRR